MENEEKKSKTKVSKVIQISTATSGSGLVTVVALRDDGTIWYKFLNTTSDWQQMKEIK